MMGEPSRDEWADVPALVEARARKQYEILRKAGVVHITLKELQRAGERGADTACRRYDPTRGRVGIFARLSIDWEIKTYLRSLDYLSQKRRAQVKQLEAVTGQLRGTLGREPTRKEVAHAMAISVDEVEQIEMLRKTFLSLDTPVHTNQAGQAQTLGATLVDDQPNPERVVMRAELGRDLHACLAKALTEEQRQMIMLRFVAGLTLQELGGMLGISTPEGMRRKVSQATRHLKRCLEAKGWEVTDVVDLLPNL